MNERQAAPMEAKGWKHNRFILCTKIGYEDWKTGVCKEWTDGVANGRRPAWIENRAKFIERRLKRPDYHVPVWLYRSDKSACGYVVAEVTLHRAGISRRKVLRLFPYLSKWDETMVNRWGEALLAAHLQDFERGIAEIPVLEWENAVKNSPHHRDYGLILAYDPCRLLFAMYPQRVGDAIKQSLTKAAMEAGQ